MKREECLLEVFLNTMIIIRLLLNSVTNPEFFWFICSLCIVLCTHPFIIGLTCTKQNLKAKTKS